MVDKSEIRYLLQDRVSLEEYLSGTAPDFEKIKRRLMLLDRSSNTSIPDQYYRLNNSRTLKDIKNLPQLLYKGLVNLSGEYLEIINKEGITDFIRVKQSKFNEWQFLIADVPPLLLKMAYLVDSESPLDYSNLAEVMAYFKNKILPNSHYTALALPYIPEMEHLLKERGGFNDMHIHLNGSTEFDLVWQFCLAFPTSIQADFARKANEEYVKELCEQVGLDQRLICYYLQVARRIKNLIYTIVFEPGTLKNIDFRKTKAEILTDSGDVENDPFQLMLSETSGGYLPSEYMMSAEALMYVVVLSVLRKTQSEHLAMLFHWYLLIMGRFNNMLVQQNDEKGFDQFQKFTLTEIRNRTEEQYKLLFRQLEGNDSKLARYIEGRFAPKITTGKNVRLVYQIVRDWENLNFDCKDARLRLVAHFIKSKKNKKDKDNKYLRFYDFRTNLFVQANELIHTYKEYETFKQYVVGIDAASNEMFVPADVFAPDFRRIRRACHLPVTYHAGEDFYSLLGGIRAVYEAIHFLDLTSGERIGHACALGLDAALWYSCVNDSINIQQGYLLDNLVFVGHLIESEKLEQLYNIHLRLIPIICELSKKVYGNVCSLCDLIEAWEWRRYNPYMVLANDIFEAQYRVSFDAIEYQDVKNINHNSSAFEIYSKFQTNECFDQYEEVISIQPSDYLSPDEVTLLQQAVLKVMSVKGIAIEALPTSNIHIGYYKNYDVYHIWNWLNWSKAGLAIPPILLGTDDCGIFSTNIYNEYAHLFCNLVYSHHLSRQEAIEVVRKIDTASKIYSF